MKSLAVSAPSTSGLKHELHTPFEFRRPDKLATLDDLCAEAGHFADWSLRLCGQCQPCIFVLSADGPAAAFMVYGKDFGSEESKDEFRDTCRFFCLAHAAVCSVLVLETWVSQQHKAKWDGTMPSESLDRREVITLFTETRPDNYGLRQLPILRRGSGQYFGLGQPVILDGTPRGRFVPLLARSEHIPATVRQLARVFLGQVTRQIL